MRSLTLLGCMVMRCLHYHFRCEYVGVVAVVVWILMSLLWVVEDGGGCACACDSGLGFITMVEEQGGWVW